MMFLYNYTKLSLWGSIYFFYPSDLIFDIILKNIDDCGCIAIKVVQWILPKLEMIYGLDVDKDEWFKKLEKFYEYNHTHKIDYTEKIYKQDFNETLSETYEIDSIVGSGSVGQVYKARHKILDEYHAIKIVHPKMYPQISFLKFIIILLTKTPLIKEYITSILPFNFYDFIKEFEQQTNMINDSNNCLYFYENYKNDDYIVVPRTIKVSKNIFIMSYEDGIRFDDLDTSDYIKYKSILLLNIFTKNNQVITNLNHGDIHKGNWKIRIKDGKPYFIVYDFGFCWRVPEGKDKNMVEFIDDTFIKVDNGNQYTDDFVKIAKFVLSDKCPEEIILDELNRTTLRINPEVLIKIIVSIAKKQRIVLDSVLIQILITMTQWGKYLEKYSLLRLDDDKEDGFLGYEYYRKRLIDIKSFCQANNMTKKYIEYIDKKIIKYNPKINDLFETVESENNFSNLDKLKNLAIS